MLTMVVVDDEQEIRNGFCNYFPWSDIGYNIVADFRGAQEACEYLHKHKVDVLVTDIRMQGMSGVELIESLRKRGNQILVVVVSGYRDFEYAQQVMRLGVRHYLVKPLKYAQIVTVFQDIYHTLAEQKKQQAEQAAPEDDADDDQTQGTEQYAENEIIRRVKAHIHLNYEDATLESAAESVKLNPYYLSSYFHQQTGEKFSDYLLDARMREASRLLAKTNLRIQEIARLVGYTTPNSFSRSFRQYYQKTPKEYRLCNGGNIA